MKTRHFLLLAMTGLVGCGKKPAAPDPQLGSRGTVEVTAKLVEVPEGAIIQRDLYDYATVLKYEVTEVHRGDVQRGAVIHVGHYNPWKPRAEAADRKVKDVGGTLRRFREGERHRMALEPGMDEHYLGGIVDKYFGKRDGDVFWAVWTNPAE
jgi:hypothetical protein